jgi:hypothetical protein
VIYDTSLANFPAPESLGGSPEKVLKSKSKKYRGAGNGNNRSSYLHCRGDDYRPASPASDEDSDGTDDDSDDHHHRGGHEHIASDYDSRGVGDSRAGKKSVGDGENLKRARRKVEKKMNGSCGDSTPFNSSSSLVAREVEYAASKRNKRNGGIEICAALQKGSAALETLAKSWVGRFTKDGPAAIVDMVNFLVCCTGAKENALGQDLNLTLVEADEDDWEEILVRFID